MMIDGNNPGEPDSPGSTWTPGQGRRLRDLRVGRGLRQQELAEALGQPRSVLSNWETGARRPSATHLHALAVALNSDVHALTRSSAEPTPAKSTDAWAALRAQLADVVPGAEQLRLERFLSQVTLFHQMVGDTELTAFRWARQRAVSEPYRAEVAALAGAKARTSGPARAAGAELARAIREQLGLSSSPLPTLPATAELCGLYAFRAPFSAGQAGRLRGIVVEQERLGAVTLLNSMLDGQHRLFAIAELLGQALLQEPPAVSVSVAWRRPPRQGAPHIHQAVTAFARELVLPHSVVVRQTGLADLVSASRTMQADAPPLGAHVAAIVELAQAYRAPASVVFAQLRGAWRLNQDEQKALADQLRRWNWRSSVGTSRERPGEGPWRATFDDLPRRFVALLIQAVLDRRASLAGMADAVGVDVTEFESVIARAQETHPSPEYDDDCWLDDWRPEAA
jgi:transcriptional regulator with XRE-family HTH domain